MARTPDGSPRGHTVIDRPVACLWWLIFLGGVGAGTAAGVALALRLALCPLPGLLLIVACWLGGNVAGWQFAARTDAAVAQRIKKNPKRIHTAVSAMLTGPHPGLLRPKSAARDLSIGLACP